MNAERMNVARASLGDTAIDNLLNGFLAGMGMLLYLIVSGIFLREDPVLVVSRFSPDGNPNPLLALIVHSGVSAIYGASYGLVSWTIFRHGRASRARWVRLLIGLFFGLAIWLLAHLLLVPGTGSRLAEFAVVHLAVAHLVYGAILGLLADPQA